MGLIVVRDSAVAARHGVADYIYYAQGKEMMPLDFGVVGPFDPWRAAHGVRLCEQSKRWWPNIKPLTPLEDSLRARLISKGTAKLRQRLAISGR